MTLVLIVLTTTSTTQWELITPNSTCTPTLITYTSEQQFIRVRECYLTQQNIHVLTDLHILIRNWDVSDAPIRTNSIGQFHIGSQRNTTEVY